MRGRSFILRCSALLLIGLFLCKNGGGLFVHNILHISDSDHQASSKQDEKNKEFNYACACIDDFLAPFQEPGEMIIPSPVAFFAPVSSYLSEQILCTAPVNASLRGPPCLIL